MKSLLHLVLLSCFAVCATFGLDNSATRDRFWFQRKLPRPPPPFDVQTPPWRLPWPRRPAVEITKAMSTESTTTTKTPIVLYKRDCDPCLPGWGVKSLCNDTSNTICQPCPMGMWSPHQPHFRPCVPCSKCGRSLFEEESCISYRDTKCDSCSNAKAKINEDFMKKCNWWISTRTMNPRELDLDDTRFDMEVLDLQSKELDRSPEFGSMEEDFAHLLPSLPQGAEHEEDITVDDPEIDLEQPQSQKQAKEEDVSKEEEEEWARVIAMRHEANDEIAQISKRLDAQERVEKQKDEMDDDEEEEDEEDDIDQGPRRLLLHPIRPFPQMVPVPKRADFGEQEDDIVRPTDGQVENNFPPSFHSYPIDSLAHAGQGQRRKAIVLLVLTCAIVLSTVIFVVCYVKEYCRRRGSMYNRVLVVNLSPEEREIVRQSADVLERMEQPPKKYHSGGRAYTTLVDEDSVSVTENPLEAYLNATNERRVAKEPLVENEVFNDPKVHRRTADA